MAIRTIAAVMVVGLASPTVAQDLDWNGFYAGIHGGFSAGDIQDIANPSAAAQELSGMHGGVQVGYNVQTESNLVFGFEADWSAADIGKEWYGRDTNQYDTYYGGDRITSFATLRGRLGFAAGNFLPYVTGGLAVGNTEHKLGCNANLVAETNGCGALATNGANDPGTPFEDNNTGTSIGWTIGAGAEVAVAENITIKGEVLYGDLGSTEVTLTDPKYPQFSQREFATTFTAARLGLNFQF